MTLIRDLLKESRKMKKIKVQKQIKSPTKSTKKKFSDSKKLSETLLHNMLDEIESNDLSGMDHLKDKVASDEAHRRYMHLQAAEHLSPEEREELDMMAHSKTKAPPDPIKKLEWDIHRAEAQKAHHQAHLNRANAKLEDPDTSDYIANMIRYLTIPEQTKAIERLTKLIDKYQTQIDQLKA